MNRSDIAFTRRKFLSFSAAASATLVLAACGSGDDEDPTATDVPASATSEPSGGGAESTTGEPQAIVGDVIDFELEPNGRWEGAFGSVTFTMHKGYFDGEEVYFIRTDASDADFAEAEGLVWVPLLENALQAEGSFASLYTFAGSANENQGAVMTTSPDMEDYTPAFRIHRVTFTGDPVLLTSQQELMEAETAGEVEIEETDIVVNYPLVRWGSNGLPVDTELTEALGPGPLVEDPDMDGMTCTFKLHQCYPGSRYIVTDTSAVPMAPMMGVVGSGATQGLVEVNATAPITIFLNGIEGPGAMGFQPAIFNTKAGDPAWSPFWDHFAAEWNDPAQAVVVTSQEQLDQLVADGSLTLYNGVPDTHPNGFVVNCPAPVLAENTFSG